MSARMRGRVVWAPEGLDFLTPEERLAIEALAREGWELDAEPTAAGGIAFLDRRGRVRMVHKVMTGERAPILGHVVK